MPPGGVGAVAAHKAERRREELLKLVTDGVALEDAVARVGWKMSTFETNRRRFPTWRVEIDALTGARKRIGRRPAAERCADLLEKLQTVHSIHAAIGATGWSYDSYKQVRSRDRVFAEEVDKLLERGPYKRDDDGHIWTPSEGFAEFRRRYLHTDSPWFHLMAIEAMESMPPGSILHILWPPEHGKGEALTVEIPTPSGWSTIGALREGDAIFAADGTPTRVRYLSPIRTLDCWTVYFSDGTTLDVDGDHRFHVRRRDRSWKRRGEGTRGCREEVLAARDLAKIVDHAGRLNLAVPVAGALDLPDVDLPVDPYVLGVWLGDGSRCSGAVFNIDAEVWANIQSAGYRLGRLQRDGGTRTILGLQTQLRALGVFNDKHVPDIYLRASAKQRLALLQGLMDTDGCCSKTGQCEFTNTNLALADAAEELIRTLGMKVRRYGGRATLDGRDYGQKHRLSFYPREPVFRIARKAERQLADVPNDRDRWQTITAIEPAPSVPTRCLQVDDPSHLFISGRGFTVSHNTRLWEDYYTFLLATDPSVRLVIGSEKIAQATKIARFVRDRLEHNADGYELMRRHFGPFWPYTAKERAAMRARGANDGASGAQAWGVQAFNVRKKPTGIHAERDYSCYAIGMGSSIIGTRADKLGVDDPQGQKTLQKKDSSEQLLETFRQDWLSRPGPTGRTYILANRVGPGDFHEALQESGIVDKTITLAAWDPAHDGWLWPARYSPADYRRMRKNAGEGAWDRNYMQKGLSNKDATFTDKRIARCMNNLRSIVHPPPRPPGGGEARIVIAVDPGFAKASFHVAALEPERFISLDLRLIEHADAYGHFGDVVDELCLQFHRPGLSIVSKVIIETKAFQKGLLTEERLLAAQARYSFDIEPFDTGVNKYDPDLGIPQIGPSMDRGLIDFPNMDDVSRDRYAPLYRQLRRWKPLIRGNRLEQDHVITFWFCVHHWKLWRRTLGGDGDSSAFDFGR